MTTCQVSCLKEDGGNDLDFMASTQVEQWAILLEALQEGSPSINATPEQMAEELPSELIGEVNDQLAQRGCCFRVANANQACPAL